MLESLFIKDIGLVKSARLDFQKGLSVLSGESGSGKSTVIDALALVSGAARSRLSARVGASSGFVEAEFRFQKNDDAHATLSATLEKHGLWDERNGTADSLVLARRVEATGRTRCFIDGQTVSRAVLSEVSEHLLELCGQAEAHGLRTRHAQLLLLDRFSKTTSRRKGVEQLVKRLHEQEKQYADLCRRADEAERRKDFLEFQLLELEGINTDGAAEKRTRRDELRKSHKALSLYEDAVCELVGRKDGLIDTVCALSRRFEHAGSPLAAELDQAAELLRNVEFSARKTVEASEDQEGELSELDAELDALDALARKHRISVSELKERELHLRAELAECVDLEMKRAELLEQITTLRAEAESAARTLHQARKKAAARLEKKLSEELSEVGLKGAILKTHLGEGPLGLTGITHLDIGFSANPGTPPEPLSRVASGGELSRVLLCFRLATESASALMIFDEIDAGAGGKTADKIAASLRRASEKSQVLCATHWAQVAAVADTQFAVEKLLTETTAEIRITPVQGEARVGEVSRMLGGAGEGARRHAVELVEARRTVPEEAA